MECFCCYSRITNNQKRDISSAKSFTFELKPLDKSFVYTKNNKGPRIENALDKSKKTPFTSSVGFVSKTL